VSEINRRELLGMLAAAPLPALFSLPRGTIEGAWRKAQDAVVAGARFEPRFFTGSEWQTVRLLADLIIPRDEHSGSATDAAVPEFMDFVMAEWPANQTAMRGGLTWLDRECRERYGQPFRESAAAERTALLDEIAWPKKARSAMSQGAAWFTSFRDFVASGFYSSKIGVEDLKYIGNTFVPEWKGCPPEATNKLGVRS
jgi:gluconate 2-dehydrogenase gamma chain